MVDDELGECEARLGVRFQQRALLELALTHASMKGEELHPGEWISPGKSGGSIEPSNERLEFLGDAVLGLVISEYLFRAYPDRAEGELTRMKSVVVSRDVLAGICIELDLEPYYRIGKGMANQGALPVSIHANVFEALVAAVMLDAGLEAARGFILGKLEATLEAVARDELRRNYKSVLQHHTQKHLNLTPTYRVIDEEGPDHSKHFRVVAVVGDGEYGTGWGRSKKEAEQQAAAETIRKLVEAGTFPAANGDLLDPEVE